MLEKNIHFLKSHTYNQSQRVAILSVALILSQSKFTSIGDKVLHHFNKPRNLFHNTKQKSPGKVKSCLPSKIIPVRGLSLLLLNALWGGGGIMVGPVGADSVRQWWSRSMIMLSEIKSLSGWQATAIFVKAVFLIATDRSDLSLTSSQK